MPKRRAPRAAGAPTPRCRAAAGRDPGHPRRRAARGRRSLLVARLGSLLALGARARCRARPTSSLVGTLDGDWWQLVTTPSSTTTPATRSSRSARSSCSAGCWSAATARGRRCSSSSPAARRAWRSRSRSTTFPIASAATARRSALLARLGDARLLAPPPRRRGRRRPARRAASIAAGAARCCRSPSRGELARRRSAARVVGLLRGLLPARLRAGRLS